MVEVTNQISAAIGGRLEIAKSVRMRKSLSTVEKLNRALIKHYEPRNPWDVSCEFEDHIMDMFRVAEVMEDGVRLVHYFDDREFEVRIFEQDVLENMGRGHIFLMAIIRVSGKWQLWYSSPT